MRTSSHDGRTADDALAAWLRTGFRAHNTKLEEAAFAVGAEVAPAGAALDAPRRALLAEGGVRIGALADDGLSRAAEEAYVALGRVGMWLAALRRHELDGPAAAPLLRPAWALCERLGTQLGVAPRYVFAHQSTHAGATAGAPPTFTTLPDEAAFLTYNVTGVLGLRRAAEALSTASSMGVSHPQAAAPLTQAADALGDVLAGNQALAATVDVDRFFACVRPYFRPYRVGGRMWRGVNAGDFSAANELDLRLGLSSREDPAYAAVLDEKRAFVPPQDAARLAAAEAAGPSLLDRMLAEAQRDGVSPALATNAGLLLAVQRAHGAAAAHHHHRLVKGYLERPALAATPPGAAPPDVTASGPPLHEVVAGLERLVALRTAKDRPGLVTARARLDALAAVASAAPAADVGPLGVRRRR